ncbi:synaptopodin-2 [Gouania willdenowi]|uniref:Synaptopodin-2-like n=1 Tax=Gouania willdenowi TaxID=441366 RepID=A0A8C5ENS5_GOUWI|nr:synaptopodin-2-like [Gouania willdenowi]
MDPMAEDLENNDTLPTWSGSEGSQDLDVSESYTEYDVIESPEVIDSDPETTDQQDSVDERLKYFESNEGVSYQEEDDSYLSDSRVSTTDTPLIETSQTSQSSHPECPESVPNVDHGSKTHSKSSSSSLEYTADMTLALTLTAEAPQGACNRQDLGTGNRRAESSEEGGSSEVPPASVFFGASNECAEQAETWYLESDTDLYRPDKHRTRYTRRSHNDSQSEKQVKETKSKCKRIARLLTEAPNPLNKGAILFKKRQQRVKKYTLVSYGTGDDTFDDEEKIEEETEQVRSSGYTFVSTSDSEVEEQYSLYHQQHSLSLNWERLQEMDSLPNAKGKGVLMFSQRRKRIDELQSEHEDMRRQGLACEAECTEGEDIYDINERYVCADKTNNMDAKLLLEYKGSIQEMNHASDISKGLVPNRTAKPFMGFQDSRAAPYMSGTISTVTKKPGAKLKVPVPIITNPQVWSPTGDIIASRDERISVPAIRTGILPESKRKPTNKQTKQININQQNKGDRCSYIEPEEDCFSLGAEACNFMQPRTVKLKNPPPVAPKPTINPACPPWMRRSPSCEQYIPPRSPVSQPTHSPVGPHSQRYLQPQEWIQPSQTAIPHVQDQTSVNSWASLNTSQPHLQQTTNRETQQSLRTPSSNQSRSLSLPRRLNSMPSPRPQRPVMTPTQRQTSCQEKAFKPLTPWEAASRSPLGSVDEAFMFQSLTSSVASNVKAAGLLMSLPQPPDEWKRRVSLDPASVSRGQHHHTAPAFQQQSMSRVLPPKKPAFCGPPFRPAQPLKSISRTSIRFMTPDPRSSKYLPAYGACSRSLLH